MVFKTPYIYNKIDCSWQSFADRFREMMRIIDFGNEMYFGTIKQD